LTASVATAAVAFEFTSEVATEVTLDVTSEVASEIASDIASQFTSEVTSLVTSEFVFEITCEVAAEVALDVASVIAADVFLSQPIDLSANLAAGRNQRNKSLPYATFGIPATFDDFLAAVRHLSQRMTPACNNKQSAGERAGSLLAVLAFQGEVKHQIVARLSRSVPMPYLKLFRWLDFYG
jgi:hypothetical protein